MKLMKTIEEYSILKRAQEIFDKEKRLSKDLALDKLCNCNYLSPDKQRELDRLKVRLSLLREILDEK